jgi:hypothetical protein
MGRHYKYKKGLVTAILRCLITAVEIITTEIKRFTTDNLYDRKNIKVNDGHESSTKYDHIYRKVNNKYNTNTKQT